MAIPHPGALLSVVTQQSLAMQTRARRWALSSCTQSISWMELKQGHHPFFLFLFPQSLVKGKFPVDKSLCAESLCISVSLSVGLGGASLSILSWKGSTRAIKAQELPIEHNPMVRKEHWKHKYLTVPPLPPIVLKQSWSGKGRANPKLCKTLQHGESSQFIGVSWVLFIPGVCSHFCRRSRTKLHFCP